MRAVTFFALLGLIAGNEAATSSRVKTIGRSGDRNFLLGPTSSQAQTTTQRLHTLHKICMGSGERLQRDVAAMVPGRTWTWQLDSERSCDQLDGLRRDLKAFWDAEAAFEAGLLPEQRAKLDSQFVAIHELFQHLEQDAESLNTELRKGYPTRWHVANDVSDMGREINGWKKLHQRIAKDLGLTAQF